MASEIKVDTISEKTSANGVTIDSVLVKDTAIGRDADNDIDFATDNNIIFRAAGADQIVLKDGVLEPVTDDDVALGTTGSKRFTNLFLSGAIVAGGGITAGGNLNTNGVFEIDVASGDPTIIFDTQGADKFHIAVDDSDSDSLVIKSGGTVGSGNGLKLDSNGIFTMSGAAILTEDTLTFDATQDWDVRASPVAKVTLTANVTFDAPSNPTTGQYISIVCIQDGTGSRTIAWNAVFEFKDDTAPTATTTASKGDMFTFRYNGSKWLEVGRNLNLTLS